MAETKKTAKPAIVTSRPIIKDPMMSEGNASSSEPDSGETVAVRTTTHKPLPKPLEAAPSTEPEADEPKAESEKPAETPEQPKPEDVEQTEEAEVAKQVEHDESIQKLIDSRSYELPINSIEKRRSRRFVTLGVLLSLVLLLTWADVALDAGLIHIGGLKAVTHFFSN